MPRLQLNDQKWQKMLHPFLASSQISKLRRRLMRRLNLNNQKWLKILHLFFASLWVAGVLALMLMVFFLHAKDNQTLYGINLAKKFVDDFIVVPGAIGCLLTSIAYSMFTHLGWFRYRWITIKWVITIFGILIGTFYLRPWINAQPELARTMGSDLLGDRLYHYYQAMLAVWGTIQLVLVLLAVAISVWKPWHARGGDPNHPPTSPPH